MTTLHRSKAAKRVFFVGVVPQCPSLRLSVAFGIFQCRGCAILLATHAHIHLRGILGNAMISPERVDGGASLRGRRQRGKDAQPKDGDSNQ